MKSVFLCLSPPVAARKAAALLVAALSLLLAPVSLAFADDSAAEELASAAETSAAPTAADKILLSIPDAGGLRVTVKPDNSLHIFVAGHDLPDVPSLPVVAFTADSAGYVNGGSATLSADQTLTNLFGTGLDLKIHSGTKLTASVTGITLDKTGGNGGVSLLLPLKDSNGNKTEIDVAPLSIKRDGTIHIATTVQRATNVSLPGSFALSAASIGIDYTHNPGSDDDDAKITLGTVTVTAPIPGVLTQNPAPLKLSVASASVNTDGQVSFDNAKLSQTAYLRGAAGGGVQVASARRGVAFTKKVAAFPLRIPLMKPADFVIVIKQPSDVTLSMTNNVPTAFSVLCDIDLPQVFSSTPGGTGRVTATGISLSIKANGGFTATVGDMPVAYFKGFGVKIHSATLDLSESSSPPGAPGGNAWEGLFLGDAELVLPDSIKLSGDGSATAPKLALTDAWIDNNGFTGKVSLSNGSLNVEEFAVKLKTLDVQVQRNSLTACDISGSFTITSLGNAPIDVEAAVADSGLATLHVKTGTINLDEFHAQMELQNGTLQRKPDANGVMKTVLALSGNWRFTDSAPEVVQGLAVQVKDLLIGSDGQFALDSVWIDMPASASIDFDVVSLEANKIGFGGIGNGQTPWVGFTGSVGIGGDLPIQTQVDFDGLKIYANPPDGVYVRVGRIGVDCDVKGIVHVAGYIEQSEGELTRTIIQDANGNVTSNLNADPSQGGLFVHPESKVTGLNLSDGKPLTILSGQVSLQLPILGGDPNGGGPGGSVQFMIARNCWFVMGGFSNSVPLIPLGQSGVAIYGFGGGVGYNIKPEKSGATGIPARDYQVIPDIAAIEGRSTTVGGLPNIIALASLRIGSVVAPPPIWGDITLMVDVGHLTFSLQGNCYMGESLDPQVPAVAASKSRVLSATISYDVPNSTFIASGYADFCIPKKDIVNGQDNTLVRLYAPFRFKIGNFDPNTDAGFAQDNGRVFYAALGGPVSISTAGFGPVSHHSVTISNPVTVKIRGLDPIEGAITLDVNARDFRAAFKIHESFHSDSGGDQSIDLKVVSIRYKYSIDGSIDSTGYIDGTLDPLNASGDFFIAAILNGSATDLQIDPAIGPNFSLPDIGINAALEADLAASISPSSFSISGQFYADVGFSVDGHSISLPLSGSMAWNF